MLTIFWAHVTLVLMFCDLFFTLSYPVTLVMTGIFGMFTAVNHGQVIWKILDLS